MLARLKEKLKITGVFIAVLAGCLLILFLLLSLVVGVLTVIGHGFDEDTAVKEELIQLYTFNYVETDNPTKRIRLEAALRRLQKHFKCSPSALPDFRIRCRQSISEDDRAVIMQLKSLLIMK
jgi:hypothetical protein